MFPGMDKVHFGKLNKNMGTREIEYLRTLHVYPLKCVLPKMPSRLLKQLRHAPATTTPPLF